MKPTRRHLTIASLLICALGLSACAGSTSKRVRGKSWVTNMTPLDLKACFPRVDRNWGTETQVEGMWVAVADTMPRLQECANDLFFRSGAGEDEVKIKLVVQPDHSVAVTHTSQVDDPRYQACISRALDMITLPEATDPAGQTFEGTWRVRNDGPDSLRVGASETGTLVGSIRTSALDACECLEDYKDTVPENVAFRFTMVDGNPKPQDVRPAGDVEDPALAQCLAKHLEGIAISDYGRELKGGYRFKFANSRQMSVDRMLRDAAELSNRREYQRALTLYDQVLREEPNHVDALLAKARLFHDIKDYERSLKLADRVIAIDDEVALAHYERARALSALKRYDEALEVVRETIELEDDGFHSYDLMASLHLQLGDYDAAIDAAEEARQRNPAFMPPYLTEARARYKLGETDEALRLLERAGELDLKDGQPYYALGMVYFDLERPEASIAALNKAERRGFDSPYLYYNRGVAHQHAGDEASATRDVCRAASADPAFTQARQLCDRLTRQNSL